MAYTTFCIPLPRILILFAAVPTLTAHLAKPALSSLLQGQASALDYRAGGEEAIHHREHAVSMRGTVEQKYRLADGSDLGLTSGQRLDRMLSKGLISRQEIEVVLAYYDEDVSWTSRVASLVTVYCQSGETSIGNIPCIPLPNVGREGHVYMTHIVNNYDNLAEWTVFSQAQEPTAGYRSNNDSYGHMLPGLDMADYLLMPMLHGFPSGGSYFVNTGAINMTNLDHYMRSSYLNLARSSQLRVEEAHCPQEKWGDSWIPHPLGGVQEMLNRKCGVDSAEELSQALRAYWDSHVQLPVPPEGMLFFAQGARFAVSRSRIRERPKQHYEKLLALLSLEISPCAGFFNEWLWHYLIGIPRPEDTCPLEGIRSAQANASL
mmetsp:Transcript_24540/g.54628  ORF Transcript_24540/g.54628 Transcript_24540/m.54628 type:complete len:376 (-) Transcript_24540:217-1344(-)